MRILKYILIGLIQGLTEPLPISSSAHMVFLNEYLGLEKMSLETEIFVNFASCLAIMIFFFKDLITLIKNTFTNNKSHYLNRKYFFNIIIASIPAGVIGILFNDYIDKYFLNSFTCSICLILTSIVLFYSFFKIKKGSCVNEEITTGSAFWIGLFQGIAVVPGLSRSGLTLSAGLSQDCTIKRTLKFSFFLYIIASIGAFVLAIIKLNFYSIDIIPTCVAFISAFVTTSFSIRWFFNKLDMRKIKFFGLYCLIVGLVNIFIYFFN